MKRVVLLLICCLTSTLLSAQSLNIRSVQDVFRPNIVLRTHWLPAQAFDHAPNTKFGVSAISLETTIPLKGKLGIALSMDKLRDWKALKGWKKLTDFPLLLSGYQLFWTIGGGTRSLLINTEAQNPQTLQLTTGLLGVHSQPRYALLFYSLHLNISEDVNTFSQLSPHLNAIVGRVHFKRLPFIYYYGIWMHYGDQQFLPVPFVGANMRLAPHWDLQVVLPLQIKLTYAKSKNLRPSVAIGIDGFWTGLENTQASWLPASSEERLYLTTNYLKAVASAEYRIGKRARAQLFVGTNFRHRTVFRAGSEQLDTFTPNMGMFISTSFQTNLGSKSFLRGLLERLEWR